MVNTNMHVFKHPKYYEEFRQRAKRCQKEEKQKLQAPSVKPQAPEASSDKRQAPSSKRQA